MRFERGICPKAVKLAVLFVGIGFVFSVNAFAVGDLLYCSSGVSLERYNTLHKLIKNDSSIALVYNLAKVSLCLGKTDEGMSHLQKASDSGHVVATYLLGVYYERNQTFNSSEITNNLENLNNAIHYYTKAAQIIESTSNYPKGSTEDMEYIESKGYTSYYVFLYLPNLFFMGYMKAVRDSLNGGVSYTDTLDVLNNLRKTAIMCVERPSLSVWKGKRNIIYKAQQIKCGAFLSFAEAVYPLEQQRIQVVQNCQVPPKECIEHQEMIKGLLGLIRNKNDQMGTAPNIHQ